MLAGYRRDNFLNRDRVRDCLLPGFLYHGDQLARDLRINIKRTENDGAGCGEDLVHDAGARLKPTSGIRYRIALDESGTGDATRLHGNFRHVDISTIRQPSPLSLPFHKK